MVSITSQPVGLGLFTAPPPIVPSLHRLKNSYFKVFKLHSHMLFDLVQPFLRVAVSLELAEISIHLEFLLRYGM